MKINGHIISHITNKYKGKGWNKKMIIMNLNIDNFFAFKNFKLNMTYPKKIVNSNIDAEYLKNRPNFRYKKVNIIMGTNATGKTSIGKMLMSIFNFIDKREAIHLTNNIQFQNQMATCSMDFVVQDYKLYRLDIKINPNNAEKNNFNIQACTRHTTINQSDSYESCIKKIQKQPCIFSSNINEELDKIEKIGWMFSYASENANMPTYYSNSANYLQILNDTLCTLDPAIQKVEKLIGVDNSFVIRALPNDIIIQDGQLVKENILSSGTKAGIDIAAMITSICNGDCGFYYCDEKFSYVHSDIEKAFLNIMIYKLKQNEQLFFTTHNMDILDLPLPKHTYTFLKKDIYDTEEPIKCLSASDFLKRNTDSLRNAVENDLFSIAPNLNQIYNILEI